MRHLISLKEQSREDILAMLELAAQLKEKRRRGEAVESLKQKTVVMLFEKTSTRTRLSFEAAATELGGHAIYLDARTSQFALSEFRDEIRAIMRYGEALVFRAREASRVIEAASFNRIPVIDACSEKYHPAQALSDILTMAEYAGSIGQVQKIAWLGIENNVSNTLSLACAKLGIEVAIAAPERDQESIDPELDAQVAATGKVMRTLDLREAVRGAQFVHTDTWMNMEYFSTIGGSASGGEGAEVKPEFRAEFERRKALFMPYQMNAALIAQYAPEAKIMHCMPCHVGCEITRDAIDHQNSIIFDQAENRLHMQKAILLWLLEKEQ